MNKACIYLLIICFKVCCLDVYSQDERRIISNAALAEKIYLQLDKAIYTTGSTIWFKSIVTNSYNNSPTDLSSVLHVELIGDQKNTIEKKLIKLNKGIGEGYFDLAETLQSGTYLIRAYTEWNKNFDQDFIFEKYIEVFSVYDEIANESKRYYQSTDSIAKTTTIPSADYNPNIDLQFFPESGDMVHGLSSKIGFKALNAYGKGITVEGTILDNENNIVSSFKSNGLGMGSFIIAKADYNKTYTAKMVKPEEALYSLPKVIASGNTLTVIEIDKNITVNAQSTYLKNDSIYLNVSSRGLVLHELKAQLKNGHLKFRFSSNELPEGIIVFKLMNQIKQALAERIYFNKPIQNNLNVKINANKAVYNKRELTNLNIETSDKNGNPVKANTSVLVISKDELSELQNSKENIMSYLLLSSELKGTIENPRFYFKDLQNTQNHLDALMLTQGWRKYKYTKPYTNFNYKPEISLTVSGTAISKSATNNDMPIDLTMMTFGKEEVLYTQTTDSLGRFNFALDDEFGSSLNVLLQSTKKSGKKVDYNFNIDEKQTPEIVFNPKIENKNPTLKVEEFVEKEIERKRIVGDIYIPEGNIALDEVLITGRNLSPAQEKVIKRFGEPDKIIDGKAIQEKEKNWSYGLYSVLLFSFPDKIRIKRHSDGILYAYGTNNEPTLVVIDGVAVRPYEYNLIESIPPSEVTSVEVIELAKFFNSFYCELFPNACSDPNSPKIGNIIAIYTKGQIGIHGAFPPKQKKGITNMSIPVFAESKEFYAPKYDTGTPTDFEIPDLRTLIHWQPIIETIDGKAQTSFYNGDITGDMIIVVEAITENGDIAYKEYSYKVD
ncbi:hypothetical protein KO566_07095 [Flavobacteriaceae bacterium XHP0103]|uniref:hypothetical protein n=1 Tax=Marixanthotalea marina TaxID=2844359 RepID=UPI002989ECA7|nr:hypothetical protein [Marixanthotalea marina]MBU3821822.1 hypothetical protein [Marixanthotalea marina]